MLNPVLVEKYGDKCKLFFNEFVERVGEETARICYALDSTLLESKDLCAPEIIGVLTDNYNFVSSIRTEARHVSYKLREKFDERDSVVLCVKCNNERADSEGIKIWVG